MHGAAIRPGLKSLPLRVLDLSKSDMLRKFRYSLREAIQAKLREDSATKSLNLRTLQRVAGDEEEAQKLSAAAASTFAAGRKQWKRRSSGRSGSNARPNSAADATRPQLTSGPSFLQRNQPPAAVMQYRLMISRNRS